MIDRDRVRRAIAQPVATRRLAGFAARAAVEGNHDLTVSHSSHDDLKSGVVVSSMSRVILSREEFPDALEAEAVAYLIGQARGTYPTRVEVTRQ